MTGPPVQTNSLTAQHSTTAHHPEMYYRYGPLVTMKSPVIGLHLTIKTDLLQRIILPKIDWPSYSMPRELIGMVKAEIMALEMQEAESAYMDRRVEKYAIMMRFNLTNRFMSSKWPSTVRVHDA